MFLTSVDTYCFLTKVITEFNNTHEKSFILHKSSHPQFCYITIRARIAYFYYNSYLPASKENKIVKFTIEGGFYMYICHRRIKSLSYQWNVLIFAHFDEKSYFCIHHVNTF